MPSRCMAPNCLVGSRSYSGPKRVVFRNPRHLFDKWLAAVPRRWDVLPKVVFICQEHFDASLIMYRNNSHHHHTNNNLNQKQDGGGKAELLQTPQASHSSSPSLLPGAVPSIFTGATAAGAQPLPQPAHQAKIDSPSRKRKKAAEKLVVPKTEPDVAPVLDVDRITSFEHLRNSLELIHRVRTCGEVWQFEWDQQTGHWLEKVTEIFAGVLDHWEIQNKPDSVCLYILQRKDRIRLTHSVDFNGSLTPQVWISDVRIKDIPEIVSWSALRDLLRVLETGEQLVAMANAGALMIVS